MQTNLRKDERILRELDKNSLCYWYPKIEHLAIPMPLTYTVKLDHDNAYNAAIESTERLDSAVVQKVTDFALILGFPVFMRTDLCSGKHDWEDTCFVTRKEDIKDHIIAVCEANVMYDLIGLSFSAICIRKFLDLETSFTAFFGNMPINKERRYFIDGGKVICHHPYWPADAFDSHPLRMAHAPDWRARLEEINREDPEEIELLTKYSEWVGEVLPEFWSVDFTKARDGKWYLIDMALGSNSYHWSECLNANRTK